MMAAIQTNLQNQRMLTEKAPRGKEDRGCRRRLAAQILALNLLMVGLLFGQSSARVVKSQGFLSLDAVRPGDSFKVAVTLQITPGYHVNAHVPSLDYLIPTTVTFVPPE